MFGDGALGYLVTVEPLVQNGFDAFAHGTKDTPVQGEFSIRWSFVEAQGSGGDSAVFWGLSLLPGGE